MWCCGYVQKYVNTGDPVNVPMANLDSLFPAN